MNRIEKKPIAYLGFEFVSKTYLKAGESEFDLRNKNIQLSDYRPLATREIEILEANFNEAENWKDIQVKPGFNPSLIKNCRFFGIIRIGILEHVYLEFKNLRMPVGIYNSTIISSDIGDNISIDRVNLLSNYQIGNEVMILQVNELATTPTAKFGNGIVKEGEEERIRIWLELGNENGGRKVIPFVGMRPADAYLWTQDRDDEKLQAQYKALTQAEFSTKRGYYGQIGDRTVIKNTGIIKDVNMGSDTYIKGANKLKNLTIISYPEANTQIGEGCELVNGIIHEGCRIFYGVKAVRFILAAHSQLKYGARLINSFLGSNSTISCCEVLNALIFPAHEQHHNNSFLCAAIIKGQSNMAAGATLGSNHNSRGADGELQAGRGFWPGLSISLKHNSKFASFNLISKGNYPAEIQNPLPFSLIGNDDASGGLLIIAAYWFQYNLYALARNAWKFANRDQRINKNMLLEYDFLAPDTIEEILHAIQLLEKWVGDSLPEKTQNAGKKWLENPAHENISMDVWATGIENSKRKSKIAKSYRAYHIFKDLIYYHAFQEWLLTQERNPTTPARELLIKASNKSISTWENLGGQLFPTEAVDHLKSNIRSGKINSWNQVHQFYQDQADQYPDLKFQNALAALTIIQSEDLSDLTFIQQWKNKAIEVSEFIAKGIENSRAKDFQDPFRKAMFHNQKEMEQVIGDWKENDFILQAQKTHEAFVKRIIDYKL
ncbi:DUF4954 family protein [Cytophagaceae bacterium 50C-KIRBA]|uniref:DUF4954 family protein n=1 Tax=Aquirufa beregesia TaxID=2516556 RepID=A0ABX0EW10_9BACT|nr:DUF4954 family protein [Aquirufa beregesia]NGZ44771.1 DUF4954 family protein [Aquirufa beregesia]